MSTSPVKTAVITGGHGYDVINFHQLFRSLEGVDAYIQHMDDFASSPEDVRDSYGAVVFYSMLRDTPTDEGLPWYMGKPRAAIEHLGQTEQGIVIFHHAILAYPEWPVWADIVGIGDRSFGYHIGQSLRVDVANAEHPITAGLKAWDMVDETYTMADAGEDCDVLLTAEQPKSMKTIAWTRPHGKSRVFCLQLGHDNEAWVDPNLRGVLRRGIRWAAREV